MSLHIIIDYFLEKDKESDTRLVCGWEQLYCKQHIEGLSLNLFYYQCKHSYNNQNIQVLQLKHKLFSIIWSYLCIFVYNHKGLGIFLMNTTFKASFIHFEDVFSHKKIFTLNRRIIYRYPSTQSVLVHYIGGVKIGFIFEVHNLYL